MGLAYPYCFPRSKLNLLRRLNLHRSRFSVRLDLKPADRERSVEGVPRVKLKVKRFYKTIKQSTLVNHTNIKPSREHSPPTTASFPVPVSISAAGLFSLAPNPFIKKSLSSVAHSTPVVSFPTS